MVFRGAHFIINIRVDQGKNRQKQNRPAQRTGRIFVITIITEENNDFLLMDSHLLNPY